MTSRLGTQSPGEEPPVDPCWDVLIDQATFCFFDLEMTGLEPESDRVIELCAVRVEAGKETARLVCLLDPQGHFGAQEIHGITPEELTGAQQFHQIAFELGQLFEHAVPIAHGAHLDLLFLAAEFARAGHPELTPAHAIDTLVLARRAIMAKNHSLGALCKQLGIVSERLHRAPDDVHLVMALFAHVRSILQPKTPRDLWEVRVNNRTPRLAIVAAVTSACGGRPVNLVYRPARKGEQVLQFVIVAVEPNHIVGYTLPGRCRRVLRMERILRVEPFAEGAGRT